MSKVNNAPNFINITKLTVLQLKSYNAQLSSKPGKVMAHFHSCGFSTLQE